jgi:hypothetical protein
MSQGSMSRPGPGEYSAYHEGYISKVRGEDILETLREQAREMFTLLGHISEERALFRYAAGKWSVKEVLGHIADGERVFAYRALRIGRGDATPLAGFEQDEYVNRAQFDRLPWNVLLDEYGAVRGATLTLFSGFQPEDWLRRGIANRVEVSVRALAWIIAGHERHHVDLLRARYLR